MKFVKLDPFSQIHGFIRITITETNILTKHILRIYCGLMQIKLWIMYIEQLVMIITR
jgi:hypothetical protein